MPSNAQIYLLGSPLARWLTVLPSGPAPQLLHAAVRFWQMTGTRERSRLLSLSRRSHRHFYSAKWGLKRSHPIFPFILSKKRTKFSNLMMGESSRLCPVRRTAISFKLAYPREWGLSLTTGTIKTRITPCPVHPTLRLLELVRTREWDDSTPIPQTIAGRSDHVLTRP